MAVCGLHLWRYEYSLVGVPGIGTGLALVPVGVCVARGRRIPVSFVCMV